MLMAVILLSQPSVDVASQLVWVAQCSHSENSVSQWYSAYL